MTGAESIGSDLIHSPERRIVQIPVILCLGPIYGRCWEVLVLGPEVLSWLAARLITQWRHLSGIHHRFMTPLRTSSLCKLLRSLYLSQRARLDGLNAGG